MNSGLLSTLDEAMAKDIEITIIDTIGSSLLQYAQLVKASSSQSTMVEKVTDLANELAKDELALPEIVANDLKLLAKMSPTAAVPDDERGQATESLRGFCTDAAYAGVLQQLLENEIWDGFDKCTSPSRSVQDFSMLYLICLFSLFYFSIDN